MYVCTVRNGLFSCSPIVSSQIEIQMVNFYHYFQDCIILFIVMLMLEHFLAFLPRIYTTEDTKFKNYKNTDDDDALILLFMP